MTGPEHDEDFERYLQQRSVLPHRLAKADQLEPPPELDRIVLAQAREAIQPFEPAKIFRPARWALPFGLAATVVIAFAVFLHMREQPAGKIAAAPAVRMLTAARELAPAPPATSASDRRSPVSPAYARTRQESKSELSGEAAKSAPLDQEPRVQRLEMAKSENARIHLPAAKASRAPSVTTPLEPMMAMPIDDLDAKSALLTPADWRAKISRLRTEGKIVEADREQVAFHKAYPNEKTDSGR
jgi:hypothetical protein